MNTKHFITTGILAGTVFVTACNNLIDQTTANTVTSIQRSARTQPTEQDMALSCVQINSELSSLYAKTEEFNKAERARQRKAGLTQGLLDTGLSVAGAGAVANAGSAQAISNIGTATGLAGTAGTVAIGSRRPDQQTYNQALAMAERSSVLERTKLAKGC